MKFIKWFFNYGVKYREQVEKYEDNNRTIGPIANFIVLVFTTAIPLLALWGVFALPWADMWPANLLCMALAFGSIFKVPSELMIFSLVAIRHGIKTRIENKVESLANEHLEDGNIGKEIVEETITNRKGKRTKPVWDFIIGTIGILLSIGVVIAFVVLFFWFLSQLG